MLEKFTECNDSKESGFSMVMVLIGVAISSMTALYFSDILSNGFKGQKALELRMERSGILQYLQSKTDCTKSDIKQVCPSKGPVQLFREDGSVLVSNSGTGTKYGNWTLRADCLPSGDGYSVKAAMLAPDKSLTSQGAASFIKNPLTGKVVTWNDKDSLILPDGQGLCQSSINNGSQFEEIFICTSPVYPSCSSAAQIAKYFTRPASIPTGIYSGSGKYTLRSGKTCFAVPSPTMWLPKVPGELVPTYNDGPIAYREDDGVSIFVQYQAAISLKCR